MNQPTKPEYYVRRKVPGLAYAHYEEYVKYIARCREYLLHQQFVSTPDRLSTPAWLYYVDYSTLKKPEVAEVPSMYVSIACMQAIREAKQSIHNRRSSLSCSIWHDKENGGWWMPANYVVVEDARPCHELQGHRSNSMVYSIDEHGDETYTATVFKFTRRYQAAGFITSYGDWFIADSTYGDTGAACDAADAITKSMAEETYRQNQRDNLKYRIDEELADMQDLRLQIRDYLQELRSHEKGSRLYQIILVAVRAKLNLMQKTREVLEELRNEVRYL